MKKIKLLLKYLCLLFIFTVTFFYGAAFNTRLGWSLFLFLVLLLMLSVLSILPSLKKIDVAIPNFIYAHRFQTLTFQITIFRKKISLLPLGKLAIIFLEKGVHEQITLYSYRGKRKELSFTWQPQERGNYQRSAVQLIGSDYFDLFFKHHFVELKQALIVLPEIKEEAYLLLDFFRPNLNHSWVGEPSFAVKNYRDYQYGDSMKQIDWKLSSKQNHLVLREQELENMQESVLIFWGEAGSDFEEMLSWYYSLQKLLLQQKKFYQMIIGQQIFRGRQIQAEVFAELQPFDEISALPAVNGNQLIIVTAKITDNLNAAIEKVPRNKQIRVLDLQMIQQFVAASQEGNYD